MPVPAEYQRATDFFFQFLDDARDISGLTSTNQAYTMAQGVFQVFRRRVDLRDAIRFANILPVGLRALFIADWDLDEPKLPFSDLSTMTKEVRALRANHNFSPETAIRDVSQALRRHVDGQAFEQVLASLPEGARLFWSQ